MSSANAASAILSCDRDGTILSADEGFVKICGYQTTEVMGKTVQETILKPPYSTYFPTFLDKISKAAEFIGFNGTIEVVHKDGNILPVKVSTALLGVANRSVIILQLSKWTNDVECTLVFRTNGSIVSVRNAEEIFQIPDTEVKSLTLDSLLPSFSFPLSPEEPPPSVSSLKQILARDEGILGSRRDGSLIPLTVQLEEISAGGVTGFCRAKIRKIDLLKDIVFILDESWTILEYNANFTQELFNLAPEDVQGKNITEFITGFGSSSTLSQRKRKRNESNMMQSNNLFKHKNGGYIPVIWTLLPLGKTSSPSIDQTSQSASQSPAIPDGKTEVIEPSIPPSDDTTTSAPDRIIYAFLVRRLAQPAVPAPPSTISSLSIQVVEQQNRHVIPKENSGQSPSSKPQEIIGNYIMGEKIGEGTYGIVRRATHTETQNDKIAVKILDKSALLEADLKRSLREIDILKKLDHPNIVKVYEIIDFPDKIYIFMEQIRGGDLLRYCLHRSAGDLALDEDHVRRIFRELVSAVAYCHSMSIIHRDIKHTNILMDGETVKLIDFGLGNFFASDTLLATFCGSPAYAAPELLLGTKYLGPEVDVWSLGIVLYSMLVGELPFTSVQATLRCDLKIPPKISSDCADLLRTMLTPASKRTHIDAVHNHRWLTGL